MTQVYSNLKPGQRESSFLHEPVRELLHETTKLLSHVRKKAPETVQLYPQLATGFSLLIRAFSHPDVAKSSRLMLPIHTLLHSSLCCVHEFDSDVRSL